MPSAKGISTKVNISQHSFEVLQALGYPVYVRKSILEEAQEKKEQAQKEQAQKPIVKKAAPRLSTLEETRKLASKVTTKWVADDTKKKQEKIIWPRVGLSMSGISGQVLVVYDRLDVINEEQGGLLINNMLVKSKILAPQSFKYNFNWPPFPNKNIDQSIAIAEKAFSSLVHRSWQNNKWKWLILLGDTASKLMFNQQQVEHGTPVVHMKMQAISSISVMDMLKNPDKRKTTWQHLSAMRKHYAS